MKIYENLSALQYKLHNSIINEQSELDRDNTFWFSTDIYKALAVENDCHCRYVFCLWQDIDVLW